jgi:hypothetical protein
MIMKTSAPILGLILGLTAVASLSANAAESVLASQPLAASAKPKSATTSLLRKSPPPTVSETSVTRQADGSLTMNCVQKPNPRLKAATAAKLP